MLGEYTAAIYDCNEAIFLKPGYAAAYYNRGWAKKKSGESVDAMKDWDKAMELAQKAGNTELQERIQKARTEN